MIYSTKHILRELKEARLRKGLTQLALSEKVGLPQSHISNIERGEVDIKISSLIAIARALGLEPMLVPRPLVPVVKGHKRSATADGWPASLPVYRLDEEEGDV